MLIFKSSLLLICWQNIDINVNIQAGSGLVILIIIAAAIVSWILVLVIIMVVVILMMVIGTAVIVFMKASWRAAMWGQRGRWGCRRRLLVVIHGCWVLLFNTGITESGTRTQTSSWWRRWRGHWWTTQWFIVSHNDSFDIIPKILEEERNWNV